MSPRDILDRVSDGAERACAHWSALLVFTLAFAFGMIVIGVDVTNIAVSYFTCALLLVGMDKARRDRLAVHVKLDDLEERIPCATTENVGLEDKPEDEIRAAKERA